VPTFKSLDFKCEISRGAVILDTNVLVNGFKPGERYHEPARRFLDEFDNDLVVPVAVLVETWGLLVGRDKDRRTAMSVLEWVNTPGKAMLLPQQVDEAVALQDLVSEVQVDIVDALVYQLATDLSRQFVGGSSIRVATYDTSDFWKCIKALGVRIEILDMREYQ
jgi:predicted nucleic acid-binding protein